MENLRVMAFLALLASCALVRAGFKTLSAVRWGKAGFAGCVLRKNTFRFACVFVCALIIHGFGENTRHIIEDRHARQGQGWSQGHQEGPRRFGGKGGRKNRRNAKKAHKNRGGRALAEMEPMTTPEMPFEFEFEIEPVLMQGPATQFTDVKFESMADQMRQD